MKHIILYIASSIDGRIAEPDGGVEFLSEYPVNEQMNYGYDDFIATVDTVLMGGRTYRKMMSMDDVLPYLEQMTYVVSRHDGGTTENIRFITDNVIETISALRKEQGKNIWLMGGGELVSMLTEAGLVDEMRIFYVPVILGKGIPLFPEQPSRSDWKLTDSKVYDNGVLGVVYRKG